jgi:hypothetical protein
MNFKIHPLIEILVWVPTVNMSARGRSEFWDVIFQGWNRFGVYFGTFDTRHIQDHL